MPGQPIGAEHARRHELGQHMAKMRGILRAHGYDVSADGPLTPRLQSAWEHYQTNVRRAGGGDIGTIGNKHVQNWNRSNRKSGSRGGLNRRGSSEMADRGTTPSAGRNLRDATGRRVPKPDKYHEGPTDPVGKAAAHTRAKSDAHVRASAHASGLGIKAHHHGGTGMPGVNSAGGDAAPGVNKLLDSGMADQIAGEQYDPQIMELAHQLETGKRDEAQHQADIGNWYGQVEGAQSTARTRDVAASDSARTSVSNELNGVLAALGGSRGAGVVGAQGLADLTAIAQQGAAQSTYNDDLAPLLRNEQAGVKSRESALASQQADKIGASLVAAKGARGQAKTKARMDILAANNAARQQNFGNRLAQQNASLAAQSLGLNAANVGSEIAARSAATNQNARRLQLESLAQQQKSGRPNFLTLNYPDRQTVINDAVSRAVGELPTDADHWDPVHVMNSALSYLRAGGYSSARKSGFKGPGVNPRARTQILLGLSHALASAHQGYKSKVGGGGPTG